MGLQSGTGAELVDSSFNDAVVVTPSNTIAAAERLRDVRGIWADVGGNVTLITDAVASKSEVDGGNLTASNAVTFVVPTGKVLPVKTAYVLSTGTAATGIKALL